MTRLHRLVGDEALRTTILALEALEREGVGAPERNVVAVAITWGFRAVRLLALACYLVAPAYALRTRWPTGA